MQYVPVVVICCISIKKKIKKWINEWVKNRKKEGRKQGGGKERLWWEHGAESERVNWCLFNQHKLLGSPRCRSRGRYSWAPYICEFGCRGVTVLSVKNGYNLSTQEAQAEEQQVQGQSPLYSEILAQSQTKQTPRVTETITGEMNKGNGTEFGGGRRIRIKVSLC